MLHDEQRFFRDADFALKKFRNLDQALIVRLSEIDIGARFSFENCSIRSFTAASDGNSSPIFKVVVVVVVGSDGGSGGGDDVSCVAIVQISLKDSNHSFARQ